MSLALLTMLSCLALPASASYSFRTAKLGLVVEPDKEPLSTAQLSASSLVWSADSSATTVGASSAQTVRLTNTGRRDLSVQTPYLQGLSADFSVGHNCPESLSVNAFCDISVTFAPTGTSLQTGSLQVPTGVGAQSVSLSGLGVEKSDPLYHGVALLAQVKNGALVDASGAPVALSMGSGVSIDSTIAKFPNTSSLKFTSTSTGVSVPYAANKFDYVSTVKTWTIEAWVYMQGSPSSIQTYRLDIAGNQGSVNGWDAAIRAGGNGMNVVFPGYGGPGGASFNFEAGKWYHLVWQRNGTSFSFGIDGVIRGVGTYSAGAPNNYLKLGGNYNNNVGITYNLQDIRLTNSVNRYPLTAGATYDVPSEPMPSK